MRATLSSLTTRGRAFVVAGATAIFSAVLVGLDDLTRIGALLLVLPLITAVVLTRGQHRLTLTRTVTPHRLTAGQTATVELDLRNEGRVPTGLLLLEEQVPYALGVRPRFVVDRMGARWHRKVTYVVRSDVRGRFTLGPMAERRVAMVVIGPADGKPRKLELTVHAGEDTRLVTAPFAAPR